MQILLIVDKTNKWPLHIKGVEIISAKDYISSKQYSELRTAKVFNLCGAYSYQSLGYYVSLLAEARGHRPVPGIYTIQDMKSQTIIRFISDDIDGLIQKSLSHIRTDRFILSIYFGRNVARHYDKLAAKLFNIIHTPFLRANFIRRRKRWEIQSLTPIAAQEIHEEHKTFVTDAAGTYFSRKRHARRKKIKQRFDLAILYNPDEKTHPSNRRAIKKFLSAATSLGFDVELIKKEDYMRIAEFDALFIRETTSVNHHTYKFARRAEAEGLAVIDDAESILRCTNKVFLAELFQRHRVPAPDTMVVHDGNLKEVPGLIGFPCILKKPDSSFSQGVVKVIDEEELLKVASSLLKESDLVIAQKFMPTEFDWRVCILGRKLLFACRYFMAPGHWQIVDHGITGRKVIEGSVEAVPLEEVPEAVVKTALKAAALIGNGLYGVDLKQIGKRIYVVEVNDNPNIDAGYEDTLLKDELYLQIMSFILEQVERKKEKRHTR